MDSNKILKVQYRFDKYRIIQNLFPAIIGTHNNWLRFPNYDSFYRPLQALLVFVLPHAGILKYLDETDDWSCQNGCNEQN